MENCFDEKTSKFESLEVEPFATPTKANATGTPATSNKLKSITEASVKGYEPEVTTPSKPKRTPKGTGSTGKKKRPSTI
jgi:hypothetical protein